MTNKNLILITLISTLLILGLFFFFRSDEKEVSVPEITETLPEDFTVEDAIEEFDKRGGSLSEVEVKRILVGLWSSLDRDGYRIEFTNKNEMTESLGSNETRGTWDLVTFEEGPNTVIGTVSFSKDGVFLKQSLDEGRSNFYYKIVQADLNRLVLIYLHEGGILGFDRIK